MVVRLGLTVVALQVVAFAVAVWAFGLPAAVIGAPLLLATVLVLALVRLSEGPRRRLAARRAARWDQDAAEPGGLMSGFFELSPPRR